MYNAQMTYKPCKPLGGKRFAARGSVRRCARLYIAHCVLFITLILSALPAEAQKRFYVTLSGDANYLPFVDKKDADGNVTNIQPWVADCDANQATRKITDLYTALSEAQSGDEIWVVGLNPNKRSKATAQDFYHVPYTPEMLESGFVVRPGVKLYGGFHGSETSPKERLRESAFSNAFRYRTVLTADQPDAMRFYNEEHWGSYTGSEWPPYDENNFPQAKADVLDTRLLMYPANTSRSDNAARVMTIDLRSGQSTTTVVDGFTIMGGGNCNSYDKAVVGGGIYVTGSDGSSGTFIIRDCLIFNNYAFEGAGIYVDRTVSGTGESVIANCEVMNNCVGIHDSNKNDGAIYLAGSATLVNSVVYANDGGGVLLSSKSKVLNTTIVRNTTSGVEFVKMNTNDTPSIDGGCVLNTIVWGNFDVSSSDTAKRPYFDHSALQETLSGNDADSNRANISLGSVNKDTNPLVKSPYFSKPTTLNAYDTSFDWAGLGYPIWDWDILYESSLRDCGSKAYYTIGNYENLYGTVDFANEDRIRYVTAEGYDPAKQEIDIGATEYQMVAEGRVLYVTPYGKFTDADGNSLSTVEEGDIIVPSYTPGDGSSWFNALIDPQEAIDRLASKRAYNNEPGEVWVAQGTYIPQSTFDGKYYTASFRVHENIRLVGGFQGLGLTEQSTTVNINGVDINTYKVEEKDPRVPAIGEKNKSARARKIIQVDGVDVTSSKPWDYQFETILQGSNYSRETIPWNDIDNRWVIMSESNHVLWIAPLDVDEAFYETTVVEGFTIQGGNAMGLDGKADFLTDRGGGVYIGPNGMLSRCKVRHCYSSGNGGGVYIANGQVKDCLVYNCSAKADGGGIYVEAQGYVNHSVIMNNSAIDGGGVYLKKDAHTTNDAYLILSGSVISNNISKANGAVYCDGAGTVAQCTITNNQTARTTDVSDANATYTSGLYINTKASVANTILWNNQLQNNAVDASQIYVLTPEAGSVNFYNIAIQSKKSTIWNNTYQSNVYTLDGANATPNIHDSANHADHIHPEFATDGEENSTVITDDSSIKSKVGVLAGTYSGATLANREWVDEIDYFWMPAQGSLLRSLGLNKHKMPSKEFFAISDIDINYNVFSDKPSIGAYVVEQTQLVPQYTPASGTASSDILALYINDACTNKDHLGYSWDQAYHNLNEAIIWFASLKKGDTISVWNGSTTSTYTIPDNAEIHFEIHCKAGNYRTYFTQATYDAASSTLNIPPMSVDEGHLHLYGGYSQDSSGTWQRLPLETRSVLNGNINNSSLADGFYHIVTVAAGAKVHFDGFMISGGHAFGSAVYKHGAGVIASDNSQLTLTNCVIENNVAADNAAIYSTGEVTLNNCVINNNTNLKAGAPIISAANLTMNHATIVNNIGTVPSEITSNGGLSNYASSFAAGNITLKSDQYDADDVANLNQNDASVFDANFTKTPNIVPNTRTGEVANELITTNPANFYNPTTKAGADVNNSTHFGGEAEFRPLTSSAITTMLINRATASPASITHDVTNYHERNLGGVPDLGAYEADLPRKGRVYYVRTTADGGDDANNGLSWDQAFATIGKATAAAIASDWEVTDEAKAEYANALASLAPLQQTLDTAEANLATAIANKATAQTNLDNAQAEYNTALSALSGTAITDYQNQQAAVTTAQTAYDNAVAAEAQAETTMETLEAEKNDAYNRWQNANRWWKDYYQSLYNEALTDYNNAVTAYENAQATTATELNNLNTAKSVLSSLEPAYLEAISSLKPYQTAVDNAQATLDSANSSLTAAQTKRDNAKTAYDEAFALISSENNLPKARAQIWVAAGTYEQDPSANGVSNIEAQTTYNEVVTTATISDDYNCFSIIDGINVYGAFPKTGYPGMDERRPLISEKINTDGRLNNGESISDFETIITPLTKTITTNRVLGAPDYYSTCSNGDNTYNPRKVFNTRTVWDGFTITGGYSSRSTHQLGGAGAAIYTNNALVNCVIADNKLEGTNSETRGGGIFCYRGEIINCYILNNTIGKSSTNTSYGGGCYMNGGTSYNCVFSGNKGYGVHTDGAGVFLDGNGNFYNNTVVNNTSYGTTRGNGGICCWTPAQDQYSEYTSELRIYNCISLNNKADEDDAKGNIQGNANIGSVNGGIIVCYNTLSSSQTNVNNGSTTVITYNSCQTASIGETLVNPNPTTTGTLPNYRLKENASAAINKGTTHLLQRINTYTDGGSVTNAKDVNITLPDTDMDYTDRIKDCAVDIGAYEYDGNIIDYTNIVSYDANDNVITGTGTAAKQILTFYITKDGWGNSSAGSVENAGCAEKLQNVLDAAGDWVAENPSIREAQVKVAGYTEDADGMDAFVYRPTKLSNPEYPRSYSFIIPDGVALMGAYYEGDAAKDSEGNAIKGQYDTSTNGGKGWGFQEVNLASKYGRNALKYKSILSAKTAEEGGVQGYHTVTFGGWYGASDGKYEIKKRTMLDGFYVQDGDATTRGNAQVNSLKALGIGGGAIVPYNGVVMNCVIGDKDGTKGNKALMGGGLYLLPGSIVYGSLIYGNNADQGGGVYAQQMPAGLDANDSRKFFHSQIISSTIAENSANDYGGGIYHQGNSAMVTNSVLWNNDASVGKNTYGHGIASNGRAVLEQEYYDSQLSLIYGNPDNTLDGTVDALGQPWSITQNGQTIWRYYPYNDCFVETYELPSTITNTELSGTDEEIFHSKEEVTVDYSANGGSDGSETYHSSAAYYLPKLFSPIVRTGLHIEHQDNFIKNLMHLESYADDNDMRGETRHDPSLPFQVRVTAGAFAFDDPTIPSYFIKRIFVATDGKEDQNNPLSNSDKAKLLGRSFYTPMTSLDDALQYIEKLKQSYVANGSTQAGLYPHIKDLRFEIFMAGGTYKPSIKRSDATTINNGRQASFTIPEYVTIYGGFSGDEPFYSAVYEVTPSIANGSTSYTETEITDSYPTPSYPGCTFQKVIELAEGATAGTDEIDIKDVIASRLYSDFNLNGIYEPWEFANQTVLNGNLNAIKEQGRCYHVVYSSGLKRNEENGLFECTKTTYDANGNVTKTETIYSTKPATTTTTTTTTIAPVTKLFYDKSAVVLDGITISEGMTTPYLQTIGNIQTEAGRGGGIHTQRIPYMLNRCRIINNQAVQGGAIYANDASLTLLGCNISNNKVIPTQDNDQNHSGGGVFLSWKQWNENEVLEDGKMRGKMHIRAINSLFANNEAQPIKSNTTPMGTGGVIAFPLNSGTTPQPIDIDLMNCNLVNNLADKNAVIDADAPSCANIKITNTVMWGNAANSETVIDNHEGVKADISYSASDIDNFLRSTDTNARIDALKNIRINATNMSVNGPRFTEPTTKAGSGINVYDMCWDPTAISVLTDAGIGESENDDAVVGYKYKDWWTALKITPNKYYAQGDDSCNPFSVLYIKSPDTHKQYTRFQGPLDAETGQRVKCQPIDIGMYEYQYPTGFETMDAVYIDIASINKKDGSSWDNASSDLRGAIIALSHAEEGAKSTRFIYIRGYDEASGNIYTSPTLSTGGLAYILNMSDDQTEGTGTTKFIDKLVIKGACTGNGHQQDFSKPTIVRKNDLKTSTSTLLSIDAKSKTVHLSGLRFENDKGEAIQYKTANDGSLTIANSMFSNNKTYGINAQGGNALIYNTLFADNTSAGINASAGTTTLVNTTFANYADNNNATDFIKASDATMNIYNTVSWNKNPNATLHLANSAEVTDADGNVTKANDGFNNVRFEPGTVNADVINGPNFVDPAKGDYRLRPSTHLVNHGSVLHYLDYVVKPEMLRFGTLYTDNYGNTHNAVAGDDFDNFFDFYRDINPENSSKASYDDVADFVNPTAETTNLRDDAFKNRAPYPYDLEGMRRITDEHIDVGAYEYDTESRRIIYVKSGLLQSDRSGSSWENAAEDLQGAVDLAGMFAASLNSPESIVKGEQYCYVFVDKGVSHTDLKVTMPFVKVYGSMDGETPQEYNNEDNSTVLAAVQQILSERKGLLELSTKSTLSGNLTLDAPSQLSPVTPDLTKYCGYPVVDGFYISGTATLTEGVLSNSIVEILNATGGSPTGGELVSGTSNGWLYNCLVRGKVNVSSADHIHVANVTASNTINQDESDVSYTGNNNQNASVKGSGLASGYIEFDETSRYWRYQLREDSECINSGTNDITMRYVGSYSSNGLSLGNYHSVSGKYDDVRYLIGHNVDLAGNLRLRTSGIVDGAAGNKVDAGCFETWAVDMNTTINADDYPHGLSVVYVNEDIELTLGSNGTSPMYPTASEAFNPGFFLLKDHAGLRGNGNHVSLANFAAERFIDANKKTMFAMPFDVDLSKSTGLDGLKVLGYDGKARSAHDYKFENANSQAWTEQAAQTAINTEGLLFENTGEARTMRFYNNLVSGPYTETPGTTKSIILNQHNNNSGWNASNPSTAKFTHKENMGWNLFGSPYLCALDYKDMEYGRVMYRWDDSGYITMSFNDGYNIDGHIPMGDAVFTQTATLRDFENVLVNQPTGTSKNGDAYNQAKTATVVISGEEGNTDALQLNAVPAEDSHEGFDMSVDGVKWMTNQSAQIFATHSGGRYSLLAALNVDEVHPIGITLPDEGVYTFNLADRELDYEAVTLIDKLTGRQTDLMQDSYSITCNAPGDIEGRFAIMFRAPDQAAGELCAWSQEPYTVTIDGLETDDQIDIYSAAGILVTSATATEPTQTLPAPIYGVALIKVSSETRNVVLKVAVER